MCATLGLQPQRGPKGTFIKRSYVTAVCQHYFQGQEAAALIEHFSSPPRAAAQGAEADEDLIAACQHMDQDNLQEFQGLQHAAERHLAAAADADAAAAPQRAAEAGIRAAGNPTPPHLRLLIPGQGRLQGVMLTERWCLQNYQGFYPSPDLGRGSHAATWGGRLGLTQAQALMQVVNWMRGRHRRLTGENLGDMSLEESSAAVRASVAARMEDGLHPAGGAGAGEQQQQPGHQPPEQDAAAGSQEPGAWDSRVRGQVRFRVLVRLRVRMRVCMSMRVCVCLFECARARGRLLTM